MAQISTGEFAGISLFTAYDDRCRLRWSGEWRWPHELCGTWSGRLPLGDWIQVCRVWRGSRTSQTGFHMHHMPLESPLVASAAPVAAVASRRLVRHRLREVPDGLGSPPAS